MGSNTPGRFAKIADRSSSDAFSQNSTALLVSMVSGVYTRYQFTGGRDAWQFESPP